MTGQTGKSPVKQGGIMALLGGGNIQNIIANTAAAATKSDIKGLSSANKDFQKLQRGGTAPSLKSQTGKSQTGKSQISRGTRGGPGTMSRKSQNETNYEEMDIEDIDARIQETEGLLKKQEKEFIRVQK